ncbi:uncharacterized protein LOC125775388 [Bactrocera dorsalis]|uniref:Uncharacterized protein LOC125775388 n=1 Tax=Bactrocera dorsalis TaxID=27457 RepID=A0ABM3IY39_BACDO|nr:uncharacterized protein LOC125775388 [Bactrocera dorsalis]
MTSIVPVKLVCEEKIIWQNPRPSSTRFCRPLRMSFEKESARVSVAEKKNRVEEEIRDLSCSIVLYGDNFVEVRHTLILSMVDGKVCNALTETSSTQKCYLCGGMSRKFNLIGKMIEKEVKMENLHFGLSTLHGWIRFFECLLHLSYKLPIKKWQARSESDKKVVNENKNRIIKEFREKAGLIIDQPKPGCGNSNDGNTARRFFQNAELSASITKVDLKLIKRMHTLLVVVTSGYQIDIEKFRDFAQNTARYCVQCYPWYNMTPTLHKFFIHGPEIIVHALLPIGQPSEEAQEARNKDFKRYREHFSRKSSQTKCNEDILKRFLVTSDPLISSKTKLPAKKSKSLPQTALELLKSAAPPANPDDDDNDESDSTDTDDYM